MKKIFFSFITALIVHSGFGQVNNTSQTTLDSISAIVIHYMQAKQADSIYALAGEQFRSKISAADFRSISDTQVFPLNDFKNVTYVSTANGISKYKIAGTPDLQLLIGLDEENKLATLLIQAYSDN